MMGVILRNWQYIVTAGILRFILIHFKIGDLVKQRVEISTPLNSWKRVEEGIFLLGENISPYESDIFHEPPLCLRLYAALIKMCGRDLIPIMFVLSDILAGLMLSKAAGEYLKYSSELEEKKKESYSKEAEKLSLKRFNYISIPSQVLAIYLLNPYIILPCIALCTSTFHNLFMAATLLSMASGWGYLSTVFLAMSSYQSFYPIMLLPPMAVYLARHRHEKISTEEFSLSNYKYYILKTFLQFTGNLTYLIYMSYCLEGDWAFMKSTYGFILFVPDLTPNVGLFWYFFTEMFEHFRLFFICTFQINVFIYAIPLIIKFNREPMLVIYSLCSLMAVFKSYPSVSDVGLYMSLFPIWTHIRQFMRQTFLVSCFFLATSVLAPIFWYLWIYAGSANANFYFGTTLAFGTAQIFLVTDVLFAYTRRQFHLIHGHHSDRDENTMLVLK